MTEESNSPIKEESLEEIYKNTSCFTYEVVMLVQVVAPNKEIADSKLDREGGYISKRTVNFKYSTSVYQDGLDLSDNDGKIKEEEEEEKED